MPVPASLPNFAAPFRGALAQSVRALPCHGRGCGFEPRRLRIFFAPKNPAEPVKYCLCGLHPKRESSRQKRICAPVSVKEPRCRQGNFFWGGDRALKRLFHVGAMILGKERKPACLLTRILGVLRSFFRSPKTYETRRAFTVGGQRRKMRRGSESNRRIQLLQSRALPLGYPAATGKDSYNLCCGVTTESFVRLLFRTQIGL